MTLSWDEYFINISRLISERSKDPSTKMGAVIVGPDRDIRGTGYNGLPRGISYTEEKLERPVKYLWMECAERNAIFAAAKRGDSLDRCTIYVPSLPCSHCARAIIQSGIREVVISQLTAFNYKTVEHHKEITMAMFKEAGVNLRFVGY